jgi:uncharacterized Zn-finger protein
MQRHSVPSSSTALPSFSERFHIDTSLPQPPQNRVSLDAAFHHAFLHSNAVLSSGFGEGSKSPTTLPALPILHSNSFPLSIQTAFTNTPTVSSLSHSVNESYAQPSNARKRPFASSGPEYSQETPIRITSLVDIAKPVALRPMNNSIDTDKLVVHRIDTIAEYTVSTDGESNTGTGTLTKCNYCYKKFPTAYEMEKHQRENHSKDKNHCRFCPKGFSRRHDMLRHERTVHKNITENTRGLLNSVILSPEYNHSPRSDLPNMATLTQALSLPSPTSPQSAVSNASGADHFRMLWEAAKHHRRASELSNTSQERYVAPPPLLAPRPQDPKDDYVVPQDAFQTVRDENNNVCYKCTVSGCNKRFTRKAENSRSHYLNHLNLNPFVCELCTQGFRRKNDIKRHIESVHAQNMHPYK